MKVFSLYAVFFLFVINKTSAQESMVSEISYPFLEKLIKAAKDNYPKTKTFDRRITIARTSVRQSQLSWFDIVSLSYLYNPNNSFNVVNPSFFRGYQLGVNVNLGSVLQKSPQIKNAKEEVEIAKLQREEYLLSLQTLVKERYFTYIQNVTILKSRMQTAQDAENIMKAVRFKFEKGEETILNYNNALITFSTQNQQKVTAEAALFIAKAEIEELIGKPLEAIN